MGGKKYGVRRGKAAARLILPQPAKSSLLPLLLPTLLLLKPLLLTSQMATLGLPGPLGLASTHPVGLVAVMADTRPVGLAAVTAGTRPVGLASVMAGTRPVGLAAGLGLGPWGLVGRAPAQALGGAALRCRFVAPPYDAAM